MIGAIIGIWIGIFLLSVIISFLLRGSLNVRKFWVYFDEFLGFVFIIVMIIYFWKFATFDFINQLFEIALWFLLLLLALFVFTIVIGIEIGNFLEKLLRKRR